MNTKPPPSSGDLFPDARNFSLVLGGPLYQLLRRAHLDDDAFSWVSNPILQFLLLRWFYRLAIWARFLWQVSRIQLSLIPTHPDRNAGLGFLGGSAYACSPLLGASDIQSLADLDTAYSVIKEIRAVPFSRDLLLQLVWATLAPFIPLVFTMIPLEELLDRMIKTVF